MNKDGFEENRQETEKADICGICGRRIEEDAVYCPDCGVPMHRLCYSMTHKCPNEEFHREKPASAGGITDGCCICGEEIAEGEGIFCTECGAPMHTDCFEREKVCRFRDRHAAVRASGAGQTPLCGLCGHTLSTGELVYCPDCGTPVHKDCWEKRHICPHRALHSRGYDWDREHMKISPAQQPENTAGQPRVFRSFEEFVGEIERSPVISEKDGEELTCCGVKQAELLHFLGTNNLSTPRFFTLFMNMANNGKVVSFNFSALFFSPLYHFYRRMTGPAVVLTVARFILMIPTLLSEVAYWTAQDASSSVKFDISGLGSILMITSVASLVLHAILLLFNDYFYMKWSVGKILSLRERYAGCDEEEYYRALEHRGNPRFLYVLGGVSLMMMLIYALRLFIAAAL